jgi:hypothetical protein
MLMPRLSPSLVRCAAIVAAALVPIAPRLAAAQVPVPTAEFAPYIGVRQITNALPDSPPPFAYIGRRIAVDRTGAFGGRIAVATDDYSAGPGRVDLVDPSTGALTPLGGSDLRRPNAVAMPWPGSFPDGVYYFQQFDFPGNPGASRKVYSLPPGAIGGLGSVLSSIGMDAGSGLAFAPLSFGPTFGGQLFGSDSGNAPGATSGDGIRRWDVAGNWTNEVMGPIANNPDSYTDVTFTGPEFGAFANRLVAINSTGVAGENILMWTEAALNGHSELDAYNTREVFAVTLSPNLPVYRAAYGTYGARGYLFAHNQSTLYRYNANGTRSAFLTASPGFNDLEFGANRSLYVADLYSGLYEVRPSPDVFSGWLAGTRCPVISDMSEVVQSWQVGGACPGAAMLCKLVREPACGRQCLTSDQQATIIAAVAAICANPC